MKKVSADSCILSKFVCIMRYTASKLEGKNSVIDANSNEIQYKKETCNFKGN